MKKIKTFLGDQSGAISVDWVVLTAAVVGLMFGAFSVFFNGITDHADLTATELDGMEIGDQYQ